ncbi:hypothetical protein UC8_52470 [Roseimaritima ulvae]|uniref:Uncharacterized protein n=1 Tax=Roseimaritima ulvae TaxID=980254 RepID=A0A5B9QYS5_9BACT|nr:hypothetical protein UC8_52470 [Roseimaritima ulvae]
MIVRKVKIKHRPNVRENAECFPDRSHNYQSPFGTNSGKTKVSGVNGTDLTPKLL